MYTEEFKRKLVLAYQSGASIESLRSTYDIKGKSTIQRWAKRYQGLQSIMDKLPIDLAETLQAEQGVANREAVDRLKTALCDAELRIAYLETLLELGKERYGLDLKKKFLNQPSSS